MRLKSFSGATVEDAMRQVREALGDEAVIISTYEGKRGRGAVVVAARDNPAGDKVLADAIAAPQPSADALLAALEFHGVPAALAKQIRDAAPAATGDDPVLTLAAAFNAGFAFEQVAEIPTRPLMLVGSPGAGKTVVAAKIAARAVLAGAKVHVFTTDTVRAGGIAQLSAFTDILKTPLKRIGTPTELSDALAEIQGRAVAVIDSPGTGAFQGPEMADLKRFLMSADIEPILVLSAAGQPEEAAEAAKEFAALGVKRTIVTQVDVVRRMGGTLAAAAAGGFAFGAVSVSPFIAQGLGTLNPVSLARLILRDVPPATAVAAKASGVERAA